MNAVRWPPRPVMRQIVVMKDRPATAAWRTGGSAAASAAILAARVSPLPRWAGSPNLIEPVQPQALSAATISMPVIPRRRTTGRRFRVAPRAPPAGLRRRRSRSPVRNLPARSVSRNQTQWTRPSWCRAESTSIPHFDAASRRARRSSYRRRRSARSPRRSGPVTRQQCAQRGRNPGHVQR